MGLLDQVIGGLMGGGGSAAGGGMGGVLSSLLGGGQQQGTAQQGMGQQPGMAGQQQGGMGMAGGLGGLLASFQQAGLGHVAQSWIGNGPNQSVSPDQLHSVLGQDQVQSMASQANMAPQDFLSQLSQHLPNAVNGMTPNGKLPDEGSVSV